MSSLLDLKTKWFFVKSYLLNSLSSPYWTSFDIKGPYDNQITFQDGYSPIMEGIIGLHHDLMFFMVVILLFVLWMLSSAVYFFKSDRNTFANYTIHGTAIEIIWTVVPSLLLVVIAIPTFALLYSLDENIEPAFTIKVIGHQWYWSYEIAYSFGDYVKETVVGEKYVFPTCVKYSILCDVHPIKQFSEFVDLSYKLFIKPQDFGTEVEASWMKHAVEKMPKHYNIKEGDKVDLSWVYFTGWRLDLEGNAAKTMLDPFWSQSEFTYKPVSSLCLWPTAHVKDFVNHQHYAAPSKVIFFNEGSHLMFINTPFVTPLKADVVQKEVVQGTLKDIAFDSFMVPESDLEDPLQLRLLEVDAPLLLPIDMHLNILVTSADVLHSWAVPALGVKMDAVAGRLNQVSLFISKLGKYYGQCSEICGPNHGFMPIVIHGVEMEDWVDWLGSLAEDA